MNITIQHAIDFPSVMIICMAIVLAPHLTKMQALGYCTAAFLATVAWRFFV